MCTSHRPGIRYAPLRSMTVASPVAALRPPDRISVMWPFSMTIAASATGLGSTQSISVALVSMVRVFTDWSSLFRLDARILRHFQPAARFSFDERAEFGATVADGLDAAVGEHPHYFGRAQYRGNFLIQALDDCRRRAGRR